MVERVDPQIARELARHEWERAEEELRSAEILLSYGLGFKEVVSAYYAVFHAAKALLLKKKGLSPQTHEGVERMFALYFVRRGEIPPAVARTLGVLQKLREEADYEPEVVIAREEAQEALERAHGFIQAVRSLRSSENL
jgi:uncharacterized protein (UPF0332 family)